MLLEDNVSTNLGPLSLFDACVHWQRDGDAHIWIDVPSSIYMRDNLCSPRGSPVSPRGNSSSQTSITVINAIYDRLDTYINSNDDTPIIFTNSLKDERFWVHQAAEKRGLTHEKIIVDDKSCVSVCRNTSTNAHVLDAVVSLPSFQENEDLLYYTSFSDMKLNSNLLAALDDISFNKPSDIQAKAIVPIINGKSTIVNASTGSGKTGAFGIAAIERLRKGDDNICESGLQIIIFCPTGVLAEQTAKFMTDISSKNKVNIVVAIGGSSINDNLEALSKGAQIIVGTPGSIITLVDRDQKKYHGLLFSSIKMIVIDEADTMIIKNWRSSSGKHPSSDIQPPTDDPFSSVNASLSTQIKHVLMRTPSGTVQMVLVSATFPIPVLELAETFMGPNPVKILVPIPELPLDRLTQFYINTPTENSKWLTMVDILYKTEHDQTFIFVNSQKRVNEVMHSLKRDHAGINAVGCYGDMSLDARKSAINSFRSGHMKVIVTTDMLAKGIDIGSVSLVINFDLPIGPDALEIYLHRIGRACRGGSTVGKAISFVGGRKDTQLLIKMRESYKHSIHDLNLR